MKNAIPAQSVRIEAKRKIIPIKTTSGGLKSKLTLEIFPMISAAFDRDVASFSHSRFQFIVGLIQGLKNCNLLLKNPIVDS